MSFGEVFWLMFVTFAFVSYLVVLFSIVGDLFRDRETSGWIKAVWIFFLVFLPFLTALVYLIARGRGMTERSSRDAEEARQRQEAHIREVAGAITPADQIAQARAMLDAGTISASEYERLKEKALV